MRWALRGSAEGHPRRWAGRPPRCGTFPGGRCERVPGRYLPSPSLRTVGVGAGYLIWEPHSFSPREEGCGRSNVGAGLHAPLLWKRKGRCPVMRTQRASFRKGKLGNWERDSPSWDIQLPAAPSECALGPSGSLHSGGARLAVLHCSWISCGCVCLRISGEVECGAWPRASTSVSVLRGRGSG